MLPADATDAQKDPQDTGSTSQDTDSNPQDTSTGGRTVSCSFSKWRNIIAFWLFGLTNNYPYVIMLSAALDIIHEVEGGGDTPPGNHTSDDSDVYNDSCTAYYNTSTNTSSYKPRNLCQAQGTSVSPFPLVASGLMLHYSATHL